MKALIFIENGFYVSTKFKTTVKLWNLKLATATAC